MILKKEQIANEKIKCYVSKNNKKTLNKLLQNNLENISNIIMPVIKIKHS